MIIDAKDMIVGRIATVAAKQALLGEKIDIVNCQDAYITGKKDFLYSEFKRRKDQGTYWGPFFHRMPDRFVRRMIRGMLPHKQDRGKKAYERIMCYTAIPKELSGKEMTVIKEAHISKMKNLDYLKVRDICKKLGMRE
jgi:large subunit ribosomal protein L13